MPRPHPTALPTSELPFFDTLDGVPEEELKRIGVFNENGSRNTYRLAKVLGQGGSVWEETWNKAEHRHECCKSKCAWRHKQTCPRLQDN